jgi:hypothetical protein
MKSAWHRPGLFCLVVAAYLATCMGCTAPSGDPAETPAMVIFTPESAAAVSGQETKAPAIDPEAAEPTQSVDSGTPAMIFFTATPDQAVPIESRGDAGTPSASPPSGGDVPGAEFTRVALELTPVATAVPRPSRSVVAPSGTAAPQDAQASGEGPIAIWPKGWGLAAGTVVAIILLAWFFARRRN